MHKLRLTRSVDGICHISCCGILHQPWSAAVMPAGSIRQQQGDAAAQESCEREPSHHDMRQHSPSQDRGPCDRVPAGVLCRYGFGTLAWSTLLPGGHIALHGCAGRLQPVQRRMRNDLVRSRRFYVSSELDCFIQTLRRTSGVNTHVLNEK